MENYKKLIGCTFLFLFLMSFISFVSATDITPNIQHLSNDMIIYDSVLSSDNSLLYVAEKNSTSGRVYVDSYYSDNLTLKDKNFLAFDLEAEIEHEYFQGSYLGFNWIGYCQQYGINPIVDSIIINPHLHLIYLTFSYGGNGANRFSYINSYTETTGSLVDSFKIGYIANGGVDCGFNSSPNNLSGYNFEIRKLMLNPFTDEIYGVGYYQNTSGDRLQEMFLNLDSSLNLQNSSLKSLAYNSIETINSAYYNPSDTSVYMCGNYFLGSVEESAFDRISVSSGFDSSGFQLSETNDNLCLGMLAGSSTDFYANLIYLNGNGGLYHFNYDNTFSSATKTKYSGSYWSILEKDNTFYVGSFYNFNTNNYGFSSYSSSLSLLNSYSVAPLTKSMSAIKILSDSLNLYLIGSSVSGNSRIDKINISELTTSQQNNNPNSSVVSGIGDYFAGLFPDSSTLTIIQRFSFVLVLMLGVTLLIYFMAYNVTKKVDGIVHYIVLIINVMMFFFFTVIGYIPLIITISIILIMIIVGIFRVKRGG